MVVGGVKLPHERYCLTGVGWGLKDEWESEGEESVGDERDGGAAATTALEGNDMEMDGMDDAAEDDDPGTMEDIFGRDGGDKDGDEEMEDQ